MSKYVNPDKSFWKGKKVFVTGHTGFKGAWLSIWLTQLGCDVTGFSLEEPVSEPNLFDAACRDRVKTVHGDLRDQDSITRAVAESDPDIIFHLAAQSLVLPSYEDPVGTYATNVMGTLHLFEAARRTGNVRAILNVTSDKCYENQNWHWGYRETEPMGGSDPYSSSKGCSELLTRSYHKSYFAKDLTDQSGAALGSARAGNVIGGGDWARNRLIPDIITAFHNGEPVVIRKPKATRPWQHVLEPLSGYILLAERLYQGPERAGFTEGWNFGPELLEVQPVEYIVAKLQEFWGEGASWELDEIMHAHEESLLKVDSSKANHILNWRSRLSIDEALAWTLHWFRSMWDGRDLYNLCAEQIAAYENHTGLK